MPIPQEFYKAARAVKQKYRFSTHPEKYKWVFLLEEICDVCGHICGIHSTECVNASPNRESS